MKKVFITAIGGDVGYGLIKALKKSGYALYIIGCDIKKYNCSCDLVDEFYLSPEYEKEDEWWKFVLKLITNKKIDYFWPVTEPEIRLVDKRKKELCNVKVIMNESLILEIAMDKWKTAEYLKKAGICTPNTWRGKESCQNKYPLIVKENFGCGSHGVKIVNNRNELENALNDMWEPIIQEYIGAEKEEYTLTIFSDGSIVNYIAFKRILGFDGMSKFVELANKDEFEKISYKVSELLKLKGSINVQMRKQEEDYYVFEINPRISSTIGFRFLLGFNDAAWWLDLVEGKKIEQYEYPNKKIYGVRSVEEKLFFEEMKNSIQKGVAIHQVSEGFDEGNISYDF